MFNMFSSTKSEATTAPIKPAEVSKDKGYGTMFGFDLEAASSLISSVEKSVIDPNTINNAIEITRVQFNNLKKYAEEGDWTWRILGLFAGLGMIGAGAVNLLFSILNPFGMLLAAYIIIFGIIAVALEYKDVVLPQSWIDSLKREAKFVYRPYGRAVLYIFWGILLISEQSCFLWSYPIVGLYTTAIGGLVGYYASQAQKALNNIKAAKYDDYQIRSRFNTADKDKTGSLSIKELATMVKSMGSTLSENELEAAIGLIDKDLSNKITLDEFLAWYHDRS